VIGAYWLQHHYSGRIYAKTDHWFGAINLLFLLAIVVIPYPIRVWCFHLGTAFERSCYRFDVRRRGAFCNYTGWSDPWGDS
jgi:uncharacterized membrane protein